MDKNAIAQISFRRAAWKDAEFLFALRNDPVARDNSLSSDPVSLQEHESWLRARLRDPQTALYILLLEGNKPIGQVRVDFKGSEGKISITVAPEFRGHGYGGCGLKFVVDHIIQEKRVLCLTALVKQDNIPSQRMFLRNYFVSKGARLINGRYFLNFERFLKTEVA